ncbi:MAG: DRTGG domain-containing protein [Anaerovoracaceae bacterium]
MQFKDIILLLDAELLSGKEQQSTEATGAFASDLMSDVLAMVKEENVLLTGLCNTQVLRTAEMLDINCVVLVRGKQPNEEFTAMAADKGICLISTAKTMFQACGLLFSKGLNGGLK